MAATSGLLLFSVLFVIGELFQGAATQHCPGGGVEYSTPQMMLQRHVYKTIYVSFGYECLQACRQEITCQSFNYVISQSACELNNRTKEASPEDFVPNTDRFYFRRDRNRGEAIMKDFSVIEQNSESCRVEFPQSDMTVFLSSPSRFNSRVAC